MKTIIQKALKNSYNYNEYRELASKLILEGKVTGNTQSEDMLHYGQLNEARMNRLDKTTIITDDVAFILKNLNRNYIWLVIAESWCGDAAQIVPVIAKMATVSNHIDLKIVLRDENDDLMNLFLTNGTKSIPKLILLDAETLNVIANFGPRPSGAKQLVLDYKKTNGVFDEAGKIELQKWYLQDKGISIQKEIVSLMP
jgi:hypothetical protein